MGGTHSGEHVGPGGWEIWHVPNQVPPRHPCGAPRSQRAGRRAGLLPSRLTRARPSGITHAGHPAALGAAQGQPVPRPLALRSP